jgi:hypothetical protein
MDIYLVKMSSILASPAYDDDKEKFDKLKTGDIFKVSIKKVRNPKFHRKYFALINMVFDNQNKFENKDKLRDYLTIKSGFYDETFTDVGVLLTPKSISFDKMDDFEFGELFDTTIKVIEKEFGFDNESILEHLNDFI